VSSPAWPEDWSKLIDERPQNLIEGSNPGVAPYTKRLHLKNVPGNHDRVPSARRDGPKLKLRT
jgi:hypothetical protein